MYEYRIIKLYQSMPAKRPVMLYPCEGISKKSEHD